jgi:hypothetical protein
MMSSRLLRMLPFSLKINSKLILRLIVLSSFVCLFSFIPKADEPLAKLVFNLQRWTDSIPQEKVYLHMDKPYYALGDTIWFKGYVTIGSRHQLSALSGAVYVDLATDHDSLVRTLKLPVTSGMVMGNFILGDDLKAGNYRVRAYTQWMRNAGEDFFFDRTFAVGEVASGNVITKADYQYKEVNNKPVLTALLNYTDDDGRALGERNVRYEIMIKNKVVWAQNTKTDALGSINININNDNHVYLAGAYIHTVISSPGKESIMRDFPIKAGLSQTDVQFFPESGSLINGITTRVAFKAVGVDGLGLAVKGNIVDDAGTEIIGIETLHAGMGSFMLRPAAGKNYSAKINFADGSTKTLPLPKVIADGYVLSVYQPGPDSLLVRIHASAGAMQSTVSLVAQSSGESIFASSIKIEKPTTSIWLSKKDFPTGIAQFTLFNAAGEPINERITFVRSNDQMALTIKTAKTNYKSKEAVWVDLEAKDSKGKPSFGNFSVSVIDESKVPEDEERESTILSNILLRSDLKGYVEHPNYYFTNINDGVNRALDNLMLTQGYRRFTWKDIITGANAKPVFEVEGLGFKVSGTVQTLGHKILPNATVNLVSLRAGVMQSATTDSLGRFKFDGIFLTDSIRFALQARNGKNSDKVKILVDTVPRILLNKNRNWSDVSTNINATLKQYIDNGKRLDDIYEQTGQLDKVQRLKEVRIKANRLKAPSNINPQGMFKVPNEQSADKVVMFGENEAADCNTLAMCLQARLPGVRLETNLGLSSLKDMRAPYNSIGIIVDGRKLIGDEVSEALDGSIDPKDIAKILLVRTNAAMINYLGGEYVLIMMKLGTSRRQYNPSIANIAPKGFNKVREFYSPKYNKPGAEKMPDLRSTIYWSPYIKTGVDGKASFSYYNADGPGNYKVIVEGINADGELARQVYRYTVEAGAVNIKAPVLPYYDKNLAKLTKPLADYNKRLPVEKIYLQTDKPNYNLGDTLWFKAYLVDNVNLNPSKVSGLLYVEMVDDSAVVARRISIPITDGLGWGQIPLPKKIFRDAGYTIRAYTNWMQNFDDDYVFSQRLYLGLPALTTWLVKAETDLERIDDKDQLQIQLRLNRLDKLESPVALKKMEVKVYDDYHYLFKEDILTGLDGSIKLNQKLKDKINARSLKVVIRSLEKGDNNKLIVVPLNINRTQNIDLQFLPEGGKLVNGLKSTVGFKAIGEDGRGAQVTGDVYDSKGKAVAAFKSLHNGMGTFDFTPLPAEVYTAKITQPTGNTKTFTLPVASPAGTVIHISNPENAGALIVNINGTANSLPADSANYLMGIANGVVYYSQKIEGNKAELSVAKSLFPSGITRFTLFRGNQPVNERVVFIDQNDRLAIKVSPNKTSYTTRDSVGLEIEVRDKTGMPVKGSFSLAVTDDSLVGDDSLNNNGIAANLLINAELKGYVERPGYYLNRKDKNSWQALDNLMLTQGWKGYSWKNIFKVTAKAPKFRVEHPSEVVGRVSDLFNRPEVGVPVMLSSQKPQFITSGFTDDKGEFNFKNVPQIDSGSYFLQAQGTNGKKLVFGQVRVYEFRAPIPPDPLNWQIQPWYVNTGKEDLTLAKRKAERLGDGDVAIEGKLLSEVKIKNSKFIKDSYNIFGADRAFDEQDVKESTVQDLYTLLRQKLPGLKVTYDRFHWRKATLMFNQYAMEIFIDGQRMIGIPGPQDTTSIPGKVAQIASFKTTFIKGVEVIFDNAKISRIEALERRRRPDEWGRIYITTNRPAGSGSPNSATYRPLPLLFPDQFYSPKYTAKQPVKEPDYRSTLYWHPNVETDQNGKARVHFFTSDIKGKYTLKIAGIDAAGGIGDAMLKLNAPSKIN